jgi:hypothetical protein
VRAPRQQSADVEPLCDALGQPVELGVVPGFEPVEQHPGVDGLGLREANQVEASLARQGSQRRGFNHWAFGDTHGTSLTPARWFATRAMVNSRSLSRLRKTTTSGST